MEFLQSVYGNTSIIIFDQFHLFIEERGLQRVDKSIKFHKRFMWVRIFILLTNNFGHSQLPLNGYPIKRKKRTPRVGPCLSSHFLVDSL